MSLAWRIADLAVPVLIAVNLGAAVLPFAGIGAAVGVLVVSWLLALRLVTVVRRRPGWLRAYRLAVVAYAGLVAWAVIGDQRLDAAGPVRVAGLSAMESVRPFAAGFGSAPFSVVEHGTVAGYGGSGRRLAYPAFAGFGPVGRATQAVMGRRDGEGAALLPMFRSPDRDQAGSGARAVVLAPQNGPPVAIVRLDLVTSDQDLRRAILSRVARHGIRPETLIVAATHTHSSPAGYSRERLSEIAGTDHFHPRVFDAGVTAAVTAIDTAIETAVPAAISLLRAHDRDASGRPILARNRRGDPADIDDRIYALKLDDRATGEALAVVVNYAFHPVAMRAGHLGYHRDAAGWLEDAVSEALPGNPPALFLNGATGDVTINGDEAVADLEVIAASLAEGWPESGRTALRVRAAAAERHLGSPVFRTAFGDRAALLADASSPPRADDLGRIAGTLLVAPANVLVWALGLSEVRLTARLDATPYVGVVASLKRFLGPAPQEFGAVVLDWPSSQGSDGIAILTVPGEPVSALGRRWRSHVAETFGIGDTLVVGLANGSIAYVADRDALLEGGYEADFTLFGPDTAANIGEALGAALRAVLPSARTDGPRPVADAVVSAAGDERADAQAQADMEGGVTTPRP